MKVLNGHITNVAEDVNAVYIGRPSKWGNPFVSGIHGTRSEVIQKYKNYLLNSPELLNDIHELDGHNLICWCAPKACHGDAILEIINTLHNESLCEY